MYMFVPEIDVQKFTGMKRPGAQARFLAKIGMKFLRRVDGSIALRQEELDAYTLSHAKRSKRQWEPDLSAVNSEW
jgi:hypothetical protein